MEKPDRASGVLCIGLTYCAILGLVAVPASAQEDRNVEWSVTANATSDYVFRGISLSNEEPTPQASVDLSYGGFYAGVWGSNVSNVGYEPLELDLYAGIKREWRGATFDLGAVWYTYPGAIPGPLGLQYVELKTGMTISPIAGLQVSPVFWYVPDQKNAPITYTFEGSVAYELRAVGVFTPTLGGLIGYTAADDEDAFAPGVDQYAYWNAGIALSVEKLSFDFRYWDTSIPGNVLANEYFDLTDTTVFGLADARLVFTTTLSLP